MKRTLFLAGLAISLLLIGGAAHISAATAQSGLQILFSVNEPTQFDGVIYLPEDLLKYDTKSGDIVPVFRGNDVGIPQGSNIDATAPFQDGYLLSFQFPTNLPGIPATIEPEDVVLLRLGSGVPVYQFVADFSDVNLSAALSEGAEDVDALTIAPQGGLLLNTRGNYAELPSQNGPLNGDAGDILRFQADSFGQMTQGLFSRFYNSPDTMVQMPYTITGISFGCDGTIYVALADGPMGPGIYAYDPGPPPSLTLIWLTPDGFGGSFIDAIIAEDSGCPLTNDFDSLR